MTATRTPKIIEGHAPGRDIERICHSEHGNCDGGIRCLYDLRRDAATLAAKDQRRAMPKTALRLSQLIATHACVACTTGHS